MNDVDLFKKLAFIVSEEYIEIQLPTNLPKPTNKVNPKIFNLIFGVNKNKIQPKIEIKKA